MKQTAVEWLFEKINDALIDFTEGNISALLYGIKVTEYKQQALQMEKGQIEKSGKPIIIHGEHQIQILEISDQEILDAARNANIGDIDVSVGSFELGAWWYREQLKQRQ